MGGPCEEGQDKTRQDKGRTQLRWEDRVRRDRIGQDKIREGHS